jgi:hypothetical protein
LSMAASPSTAAPAYRLSASADILSLDGIRSTLDTAAGGHPVVKQVLDIVRGGKATDVRFSVAGDSPSDLAKFEAMTISGQAVETAVHIPGIDLALEKAAGAFRIQNGTLTCKGASAVTGGSRVANGDLELSLVGEDDTFVLGVDVDAHLPDLPPVLRRILAEGNRQWLDQVDIHEGSAKGRLMLGDRLSDLGVIVKASEINGSVHVEGLPQPVVISSGDADITEEMLSVSAVAGSMGGIDATDLSGSLEFNSGVIAINGGRARITTEVLYPWIIQQPALAGISAIVGSMTGDVLVERIQWESTLGALTDDALNLRLSTDSLALAGGAFPDTMVIVAPRVDIRSGQAAISNAHVKMSDSRLAFSGDIRRDSDGLKETQLHVSGRIGDRVFRQLAADGRLPKQLIIQPPLTVNDLQLAWRRDEDVSILGDLQMAAGPVVSVDAAFAQENVNIRRLRIVDSVSDGTFSFHFQNMSVSAGFKGKLFRNTVDHLLVENTLLLGSLQGDCTILLPLENPGAFEMHGALKGEGIAFPDWMDSPMALHRIDIDTVGQQVVVNTIDATLLGSRLKGSGQAGIAGDALQLAMTIEGDHVDVAKWVDGINTLTEEEKQPRTASETPPPKRPFEAALDLSVETVTTGGLTWQPVDAAITVTPGAFSMVITRAATCGISLPGNVNVTPGAVNAAFTPSAESQNLNATLNCLSSRPVDVTGTYTLTGTVTADGPRGDMLQILSGDIRVVTSSGTIYHVASLENIFSMLNLPGLIGKDYRARNKEGLAYEEISTDIRIGDGVVTLDNGIMKGPMMQLAFQGNVGMRDQAMDVTVFVVPLKSIVTVASKIPLIGRIVKGEIISIPVKVSGTLKKPQYIPLAPEAVGKQAVRLLRSLILLPVEIIQPIVPDTGYAAPAPPPGQEK